MNKYILKIICNFDALLLRGVIGNTPDSGSGKFRFEP